MASDSMDADARKRVLFTNQIVVFTLGTAMFLYITLMPFIYEDLKVDTATYGYIQSIYSGCQLVLSLGVGWIGDAYGARAVLLLACVSSVFANVLSFAAWNIPVLLLARVASLFHDGTLGTRLIITDIVPVSDRTDALGKQVIPFSLAVIVGPLVAGTLAGYIGSANAHLLATVLPLTTLYLLLKNVPKRTGSVQDKTDGANKQMSFSKVKQMVSRPKVLPLLLLSFSSALPSMTYFMNFSLLSMKILKLTPQLNGLAVALCGAVSVVVNGFLVGRLIKRFGNDLLIKSAPILALVVYSFLILTSDQAWLAVLCNALLVIPYGILENETSAQLSACVDQSEKGFIMGIGRMVFFSTRMVAPLYGAWVIDSFGFPAFGLLGIVSSLFSIGMVFRSPPSKLD